MFEDWKKIASKIVVNYITVFLIYFFLYIRKRRNDE